MKAGPLQAQQALRGGAERCAAVRCGTPVIPTRGLGHGKSLRPVSASNVCFEGWLRLLTVPADRDTFPAGP